jgi:hypothetical protein
MIAITFPCLKVLTRPTSSRSPEPERNSLTTMEGKVGNHEIEIMHTGVGEKIAARLPVFLQGATQTSRSAGCRAVGNDLAADLILSRVFGPTVPGQRARDFGRTTGACGETPYDEDRGRLL